jgi:hypothetical protein
MALLNNIIRFVTFHVLESVSNNVVVSGSEMSRCTGEKHNLHGLDETQTIIVNIDNQIIQTIFQRRFAFKVKDRSAMHDLCYRIYLLALFEFTQKSVVQ